MPRGNTAVRLKKDPENTHASRIEYLASKDNPASKICHRIAGEYKPWVTLVVGSGCATSRSQEDALFRMADRLSTSTPGDPLPDSIEGELIGTAVGSFAADLICDRLRLDVGSIGERLRQAVARHDGGRADEAVPDWLFELFAAAALSSRLYFRIKSLAFEAPRRPDRDDDAVLDHTSRSWGTLDEEFVMPCRRLLTALLEEGKLARVVDGLAPADESEKDRETVRRNLRSTVGTILDRIASGLRWTDDKKVVRVGLTDLRALTEFAWFCFTKVTTPKVYPGWSDLLLDLSNYDASAVSVGTPLFPTMTGAQSLIKSRYAEVTNESWRRLCGEEKLPESLHYLAARLLNAQHDYRRSIESDYNLPPLTTAFVTSFDLELELSLLHLKEPFTVALPVHVLNTKHDVAHTCWIALRVPRASESDDLSTRLDQLTHPDDDCWSLLTEGFGEEGPVVIRLAGCPLVRLPDLLPLENTAPRFHSELIGFVRRFLDMDAKKNPEAMDEILNTLQLQHAVVINEHDAILQSAIDLISIPEDHGVSGLSIDGSGLGSREGGRRGLPARFAAGERRWSRFWMMLGVQIHDSAVRHRITTLISSLPITAEVELHGGYEEGDASTPTSAPPPTSVEKGPTDVVRNGVAVNKHLTALEQDLLFWNGFDIVGGDISDFAKDLVHYAAHLACGKDNFVRGGECKIP